MLSAFAEVCFLRNMIDFFTQLCRNQLGIVPVKEHVFHSHRKWRFDYAFPEHKVALEVEGGVWTGGRHTSSRGFLGDMEKYNAAACLGWRLLRCTPDTLCTMATLKLVKTCIDGKEKG